MALNLPNSPAVNSVYTTPDGSQYKWDGVKWTAASIYVTISDVAPSSASAAPGSLWWDSVQGDLYILFSDSDYTQWVPASSSDGLGGLYLPLLGGSLTGPLLLAANPTQALEAVTKQYTDRDGSDYPCQLVRDGCLPRCDNNLQRHFYRQQDFWWCDNRARHCDHDQCQQDLLYTGRRGGFIGNW